MANVLTGIRIICSIVLLFAPAYSVRFYLLYVIAGITDMLDGIAARKFNEESKVGAIFDSIADCLFVGACLFKLIPLYDIPLWLYIWIAIIILLKLSNVILGFAIHKTLIVEHTVMNKITGILLFVFPFTYSVIPFESGTFVLCAIASFSAIQEGYYIKMEKIIK